MINCKLKLGNVKHFNRLSASLPLLTKLSMRTINIMIHKAIILENVR
jgi:hypothetical protein